MMDCAIIGAVRLHRIYQHNIMYNLCYIYIYIILYKLYKIICYKNIIQSAMELQCKFHMLCIYICMLYTVVYILAEYYSIIQHVII